MPSPILIHEVSSRPADSSGAMATSSVVDAYRDLGVEVFRIPANWPRFSDAATVLKSLPHRHVPGTAILCGYVHSTEDYTELFSALRAKNLSLINDPDDYLRCHSFERAYPLLRELTPKTVVIRDVKDLNAAVESLGLPVFIKGAVQSRKDRGWKSCVAKSVREAQIIVESLLNAYTFSEGVAIIREFVPLRHVATRGDGFPLSREFRIILYNHEPLGFGYYWPGADPLQRVSNEEKEKILQLGVEASKRLNVPYVAIDIAQRADDPWIVVEPGDPQSAGFPNIDLKACFGRLVEKLSGKPNPPATNSKVA